MYDFRRMRAAHLWSIISIHTPIQQESAKLAHIDSDI